MKNTVALAVLALTLPACGGGGGETGPSPSAGVTLLSAEPPPGSTIILTRGYAGQPNILSAPISMVLSIVSDHDISPADLVLYWYGAPGRHCAFNPSHEIAGWSKDVKAGQAQTVTVHTVLWSGDPMDLFPTAPECTLPMTTSRIVVDARTRSVVNPATFARELSVSYTFVDGK